MHKGLDYGRSHNPTRWAFERNVADLEGGAQAFAFASGLAAIATVLELLDAGSHVVCGDDVYGGTFRLFDKVRQRSRRPRRSASSTSTRPERLRGGADAADQAHLGRDADQPAAASSPTCARCADIARARGILTAADNTFASPYNQRPLELGFDIVVHSATKYLNGHSDVIGGVAIVGTEPAEPLRERLGFLQNAVGAIAGPVRQLPRAARPEDARAAHASATTRTRSRSRSGWRASRRSGGCTTRAWRRIRSTRSHVADATGGGYGGMISLELRTDLAGTRRFLEAVRIFALAESLGGVESLIEHPAIMTHATIPPQTRAALGIGDSLVRLSVGIEDVDDLREDLAQALATV